MRLLNTIREFLLYWSSYTGLSVEEMFGGWLSIYMAAYPELLEKQVGWWGGLDAVRKAMVERVLPKLDAMIHEVFEAWRAALEVADEVCDRAAEKLGEDIDPVVALYVGSRCGAGWATTLVGRPALLIGLESAAELGWTTEDRMRGLIAHGLGHLYHMKLRGEWAEFEEAGKDPLFQLYSEGFAQACEHAIIGIESWHVATGEGWAERCEGKLGALAERYLQMAEEGDVKAFYSPRLDVEGVGSAGYYLGHRLITWLRGEGMSTEEIALLPKERARKLAREFLTNLSP